MREDGKQGMTMTHARVSRFGMRTEVSLTFCFRPTEKRGKLKPETRDALLGLILAAARAHPFVKKRA